MGLPWIQVDANLPTHRKSVHLAAVLGDRRAWTYLVQLWSWASQNEPSGLVRGAVARMVIEHAAGWAGDPDKLTSALIETGWVDKREDGLYLHDWHDHQGAHIDKANADAERKRRNRSTPPPRPEPVRDLSATTAPDVPKTSTERRARGEVRGEERREDLFAAEAAPAPSSDKKQADPRHAPTVRALTDLGFSFQGGRHAKAVSDLLKLADTSEIVTRAKRALARNDYPKVRAIHELLTHWDHFATDSPTGRNEAKRDQPELQMVGWK